MNFWKRVEAVAERRSVLRHPFYIRWSEGTLTREELAGYSGQYRHAVTALALAAATSARSPEAGADAPALAAHATEEASHIALWDEFVTAADGDASAVASEETRACVEEWAGEESRPLVETLMTMYTIESAQPAISETKLAGLRRHYGTAGSAYFEVHKDLDVEHAAELRELIIARLPDAAEGTLLSTTERVLDANWLLLDGVERDAASRAAG